MIFNKFKMYMLGMAVRYTYVEYGVKDQNFSIS